jgi:hypothetical protein
VPGYGIYADSPGAVFLGKQLTGEHLTSEHLTSEHLTSGDLTDREEQSWAS